MAMVNQLASFVATAEFDQLSTAALTQAKIRVWMPWLCDSALAAEPVR
jgi:hypothetical protein